MKIEGLTPTEYLVIEVLIARYRLGETTWTFHTQFVPQLDHLEEMGYVGTKSGVIESTKLAWFTDKGKDKYLSGSYTPPIFKQHQRVEWALQRALETLRILAAFGFADSKQDRLRIHIKAIKRIAESTVD